MIFYLKPTTLKKMLTLSLNDMQSWQQASNYRAARPQDAYIVAGWKNSCYVFIYLGFTVLNLNLSNYKNKFEAMKYVGTVLKSTQKTTKMTIGEHSIRT